MFNQNVGLDQTFRCLTEFHMPKAFNVDKHDDFLLSLVAN